MAPEHRRRAARAALVASLLLAAVPACGGDDDRAEATAPTSVVAPTVAPSERSGTVIVADPLDPSSAPPAWKVTYRTTSPGGDPVEATALVAAPEGEVPPGGRPVVVWAHGTSGLEDECAPSGLGLQAIPLLDRWLEAGAVVVAPDYQGLGSPGPHPYLVGTAAAHDILDAVRAAASIPETGASARVVVWGHSQGGHAALFAGEQAPSYAPELDVVGVVALAPVTELDLIAAVASLAEGPSGLVIGAAVGFASAYPELDLADLFGDDAARAEEFAAGGCLESLLEPTEGFRLRTDPNRVPEWRARIEENSPGRRPSDTATLVLQGGRDAFVFTTERYVRRRCERGEPVELRQLPDDDHVSVVFSAAESAFAWLEARLAGGSEAPPCELSEED